MSSGSTSPAPHALTMGRILDALAEAPDGTMTATGLGAVLGDGVTLPEIDPFVEALEGAGFVTLDRTDPPPAARFAGAAITEDGRAARRVLEALIAVDAVTTPAGSRDALAAALPPVIDMHPHRSYTENIRQQLTPEQMEQWAETGPAETKRILTGGDESFLPTEMAEAETRWNHAFAVIQYRAPSTRYGSLDDAKLDLVLNSHRYWTSYDALRRLHDITEEPRPRSPWRLVAVGFIAGVAASLIAWLWLLPKTPVK